MQITELRRMSRIVGVPYERPRTKGEARFKIRLLERDLRRMFE